MSYFLSLRGSVPVMSTMAMSLGSLATSAPWIRSRSRVFQLRVELGIAPRFSFHVTVSSVCLPTVSDISLTVSVDFPPRNSVVSQLPSMMSALSLYIFLSCVTDCRMAVM